VYTSKYCWRFEMRFVILVASALTTALPAGAEPEQTRQQDQPQRETPATTIANVMAGVAFATRCGVITVDEATQATKYAMIYGAKHGIKLTDVTIIGEAAIAATARMPDYTFTDSLCSLYATGVRNLLEHFDK
jgi:Zn-dependent alcohol dehydrogenase